jgi:N-acetyl-gamma-glutamyl-phosphate/LysW-gamma-L-alpha-aminoadipyl-6-phosphate reductase
VSIQQVTSASSAGRFAHTVHPNLRANSSIKFVPPDALKPVDILFLAQPHGATARHIDGFAALAQTIIDTSADFRLDDPERYADWYGEPHPAPQWLPRFVYGLPERMREPLRDTDYASGVGCNATVATLAIAPLADGGMLDHVVADVKVGSSEAGAIPTASSHHPERSGAVRSFKPTGHRHQAEIRQSLGDGFALDFSVTSVELVRGALVTAHCFLTDRMSERDVWQVYRKAYGDEPFIRLVSAKSGLHRYPDPKILAGSNFCDVGFVVDEGSPTNRVVVIAALDNLMKGAAGSAVQCLNLMRGWDETTGLTFPGLHPI